MISTITMASLLALWFYKIWTVTTHGPVTEIVPMNLLLIAILCSAIYADRVRRRLT